MKTKTECHEIEPNLWKDRAMPEGDNHVDLKFSGIAVFKMMIFKRFFLT
jgi:hypothetical protein